MPVSGTTTGATVGGGLGARQVQLVRVEVMGALVVVAAAQKNAVQQRVVVVKAMGLARAAAAVVVKAAVVREVRGKAMKVTLVG